MDSDCECRGQCEARSNCAGFTYLPNTGLCYLKNYLIGSSTFVWRHDRVTGFVGMWRDRAAISVLRSRVWGRGCIKLMVYTAHCFLLILQATTSTSVPARVECALATGWPGLARAMCGQSPGMLKEGRAPCIWATSTRGKVGALVVKTALTTVLTVKFVSTPKISAYAGSFPFLT